MTRERHGVRRGICWAPVEADARGRLIALSSQFAWDFRSPEGDRRIGDAEVVIGPEWPIDSPCPQLRWVQFGSAGVERLLPSVRLRPGLLISNAKGVYATQVGEYVVGAALRRFSDHVRVSPWRSDRSWPGDERGREPLRHRRLRGATIVVVGYGGLGREVARVFHCFGAKIVAVKARPDLTRDTSFRLPDTGDPEGHIPEEIVGVADLARVAQQADILVITAPLTDRTRHLINAEVLRAIKPGAVLINVARGGLVDEDALLEALEAGRVAVAVLDVLSDEPPPPTHPFWVDPRVDLTPHIAAGGRDGWRSFESLILENVGRYLRGEQLVNLVDVAAQY